MMFKINNPELPKGGKGKFNANKEAITLLKLLEKEKRYPTVDECETLSKYVGWGGIPQAFDSKNQTWEREYESLKELLTEDEYKSARASVNDAFYTPYEVAKCMDEALISFGLKNGSILEPAMGIGNFFGCMPDGLNAALYGVEIDSISGRIAQKLYPEASISICGIEKANLPENFFDAVIGNVPFGDFGVYDDKYAKYNFKIHDYFLAKALDLVRPGGIVFAISSKGTLDKHDTTFRKYLSARADLAGAIRLPKNSFKENAGTEVTTDILILQKKTHVSDSNPEWIHVTETEDGVPVNKYFNSHPDNMFGKMEFNTEMFGEDSNYTDCVNHDSNFSIKDALKTALSNMDVHVMEIFHVDKENGETEESITADPKVKNFTYTFSKGKLYFRKFSRMYKIDATQNKINRIHGMSEIRNAMRNLIHMQSNGCTDAEFETGKLKLNRVYDTFVRKYGYITGRENKMAFRDDADYPLLCSLEMIDEKQNITKADMFYKRTINPVTEIHHVDTAVEALQVSMNKYGYVNIPYMSRICSETENSLKKSLKDVIYKDPETENWVTADEYLSGEVRKKLEIAKKKADENPFYEENVKALEAVQPEWVDAASIDVRLGMTWIDPCDYEEFVYQLLNTPARFRYDPRFPSNGYIRVRYNGLDGGEWAIENKGCDNTSVTATETYGTKRADAYSLIETSLNLRTVTVRDRIDNADGSYYYVINKDQTLLAREKQEQIKQEFKDWLFKDPDRREKYVNYYNKVFNNIRLREYDGSYLTFPGMNPEIKLQKHQLDAVSRILLSGNTLLAHVVGAGKSFALDAACMKLKQLGIANKIMMVVPKPLIMQTSSEFLRLYPSANLLVATERDFEKSRRQQFISRIATGNYDCVILSHSQFEKIPVSDERKKNTLNEKLSEITDAIEKIKFKNGERWTLKKMEAFKKKLDAKLKELNNNRRKDDVITFEELGVDTIMVDEAHNYKNLAVFSKINNVSGISSTGSQKASDMEMKCQYINEKTPGHGVVFATGTPISNTMCEMFVMQTYLQKDTLEQMGLSYFDSWAANFGEVTTELELAVEGGGFRFKSRFNRFTNVPELIRIFKLVADIKTASMLNLDTPDLKGGKPIIVESEPDSFVRLLMEDFVLRAEMIRKGMVERTEDNFLKITNEARLLGTDARLLYPDAPNSPGNKLNKVVDNVWKEYKNAKDKNIIGCQLIVSDIGTPKDDGIFTVYSYLKNALILKGIPEKEIAFIHDAKTNAQQFALFREMRTGKKKILIGSTDKCGTGANIQTHLVALHHVDCPWKPSSIEQREGRIIRKGNLNKEVTIYRYVTKETFDAYNWSILENKQRFIDQIMNGKTVTRTCEDIDAAALSYAEIKAVATGNPLIKEKMEVDSSVQRLRLLKSSYDRSRYSLQDNYMVKFPSQIKKYEEKLKTTEADIEFMNQHRRNISDDTFLMEINGTVYDERNAAGEAIISVLTNMKQDGERKAIGHYFGFKVIVEKTYFETYVGLENNGMYRTESSSSPVGVTVRLDHIFTELSSIRERVIFNLEKCQQELDASKREYEKPFAYATELEKMLKRQVELNNILDITEEKDNSKDYSKLRLEIAQKRDAILSEEREIALTKAKEEAAARLKEAEKAEKEYDNLATADKCTDDCSNEAAASFDQLALCSAEIVTTKRRKKKNYEIEGQLSFFGVGIVSA